MTGIGRSPHRWCVQGCTGLVAHCRASRRSPPAGAAKAASRHLFYRALVQSGNTAPVDALARALSARRLRPVPIFVQSLKEGEAAALLAELSSGRARAGGDPERNWFFGVGAAAATIRCGLIARSCRSSSPAATWRAGAACTRGLGPRDLAMNVPFPRSTAASCRAPCLSRRRPAATPRPRPTSSATPGRRPGRLRR